MKRVLKSQDEPDELRIYREYFPENTWEVMRDDPWHRGLEIPGICRERAIEDQFGLCAYCECKITSLEPAKCRVEHFHQKSDREGGYNWDLDWSNMLAACIGGANEEILPLPENLSCDAYKNHAVQKGKIPASCTGIILNPLCTPPFPCLFDIDKRNCKLIPNKENCEQVFVPGDLLQNTEELVQRTIDVLNLNCDRLLCERVKVFQDIERKKARLRKQGVAREQAFSRILSSYFYTRWPEYFTTIRCLLGEPAESYLQSIGFEG